ncbi:1-deoxy-D-xylulose-5-phosphate reductoisomerase [Patescibacteria group bacterium]|nr:1-deoxy-D-xylulose-5-phosphate reductoisomerase [Patescibacteria group bacterium]
MIKKIAIFGSTGSIGTQSLEVLRTFPDKFEVVALSALQNAELLEKQATNCRSQLGPLDKKTINSLIAPADYVINAVPGFEGLLVSLQTVKAGKVLLAANKESLAIAGRHLCMIAKKTGAQIRPLDSEASAIWQLIFDHGRENVASATLTCSGGPFFGKKSEDLKFVTAKDALAHPTWQMGPKVSIDSATLINKILEAYEVSNLFDIPITKIQIVIHRQSVVHSMIHTYSGATKMHITQCDMRLPISYALNYPEQPSCPWQIKRTRKSELSFDTPDAETFRPIKWFAMHKGNPIFPIALNALNDIAVSRFLSGKIGFLDIYDFIENGLQKWLYTQPPNTLEEIISLHHRIQHSRLEGVRSSDYQNREANATGGSNLL